MASNNGTPNSNNPLSNPGWRQRAAQRAAQTANSSPKKGGFQPQPNVEIACKLVDWTWREDKAKDGRVYADTFVLTHMVADATHPNYLATFRTYYKIWPQKQGGKVDPETGKPYGDRMTGWLRGFMAAHPEVTSADPKTGEVIDMSAVETNWPAILDQLVTVCKGDIAYLCKPILLNTTNKNRQTGVREPGKPTLTVANVKFVSGYSVGEAPAPPQDIEDDDDAEVDDAEEPAAPAVKGGATRRQPARV